MRTHDAPQLLVPPLGDEVHVEFTERGEESVGVIGRDDPSAVGHVEPVVGDLLDGKHARPDPAMLMLQRYARPIVEDDDDRLRHGAKHAYRDTVLARMGAEDGVRIMMLAIDDPVEIGAVDLHRPLLTGLLGQLRLPGFLGPLRLAHGACRISAMCATLTAGSSRT